MWRKAVKFGSHFTIGNVEREVQDALPFDLKSFSGDQGFGSELGKRSRLGGKVGCSGLLGAFIPCHELICFAAAPQRISVPVLTLQRHLPQPPGTLAPRP